MFAFISVNEFTVLSVMNMRSVFPLIIFNEFRALLLMPIAILLRVLISVNEPRVLFIICSELPEPNIVIVFFTVNEFKEMFVMSISPMVVFISVNEFRELFVMVIISMTAFVLIILIEFTELLV